MYVLVGTTGMIIIDNGDTTKTNMIHTGTWSSKDYYSQEDYRCDSGGSSSNPILNLKSQRKPKT